MKIKMKTPGRNGKEIFKAGAVIDVAAAEAKTLVARGVAEYAGKKPTDDDASINMEDPGGAGGE